VVKIHAIFLHVVKVVAVPIYETIHCHRSEHYNVYLHTRFYMSSFSDSLIDMRVQAKYHT